MIFIEELFLTKKLKSIKRNLNGDYNQLVRLNAYIHNSEVSGSIPTFYHLMTWKFY